MPLPPPPRKREQAVRSFFLPAVSLAHLSLFLLARRGDGWAGWAVYFAASAAVVLVIMLMRDLLTSRRRDRLPDVPGMLAWGGAALLEIGALYPAVSETRIVPAILFPSLSFLLSAVPAAIYSAVAFAWLLFSPDGNWPSAPWSASIAGLGGFGLLAGWMARRKIGAVESGRELMKEAIHESRLLVQPWENPEEEGAGGATPAAVERMGLLRSREELMDGVRRILDGILPFAGAEWILYVFPSPGTGRAFRVGASAHRGGDPGMDAGELTIPDDYIPVREAMLFRRTFLAEGEEAWKWQLSRGDGIDGHPTGVAAAPVCIEEKVAGAMLAMRFADGKWTEPAGQVLEMAAFLAARELSRAQRQYRMDRYLADQEGFHLLVRKIAEISETRDGEEKDPSPCRISHRVVPTRVRRSASSPGSCSTIGPRSSGRTGSGSIPEPSSLTAPRGRPRMAFTAPTRPSPSSTRRGGYPSTSRSSKAAFSQGP